VLHAELLRFGEIDRDRRTSGGEREVTQEWPDFGQVETPEQRRERERSIRDAASYVRDGRHVDVELTSEWVEHPVTGEPLEVLGWRWDEAGDDTPWCGEVVTRWADGRQDTCERPAGAGTDHEGAGPCRRHEARRGRGTGAWIVAHAFARALDISPWEGLLWGVKIAAGRLAFCEQKLSTATCDEDLLPTGPLWHWVKQAELWHKKLTVVSKLAIDAGVAERLVRQVDLEAQLMLRATTLTMDELGLNDDQRERALGIMSRNLLALEAEQTGLVRSEE
jgi:hypothetical protein